MNPKMFAQLNSLPTGEREQLSSSIRTMVFLRAIDRAYKELSPEDAERFAELFREEKGNDEARFAFFMERMPNFPKFLMEESLLVRNSLLTRAA